MAVPTQYPIGSQGRGLWQRLDHDLRDHPPSSDAPGIWAQIGLRPGGLWGEAQDETVLLNRQRRDIWQQLSAASGSHAEGQGGGLWHVIEDETIRLSGERHGLWKELQDETLVLARSKPAVWQAPLRSFARYKPVRARGWALKRLTSAAGEEYYILKSLREGTYLRLDEQGVYLWNRMDGSQSVQDLAVANFLRYRTLSPEWLSGFLDQLHSKGFLMNEGVDVYQATRQQLWQRSLDYWWRRLVGLLFRSELSIRGVDSFFGALYRFGGRVLFIRPVQLIILMATLAGLPAFLWLARLGDLSFTGGSGDVNGTALVGLLVAQILAVFLHECAHGVTTKHYGRQVRRGGVGLYFGMLVFFVDTTDIWMEPRRPRLAVTWAGPYSGFLLGGLASLVILLGPDNFWKGLAYQFAIFCYAISVLNLNPLLKLDGYYMLMDWLEMPMLRERSVNFVRRHLWTKLRDRQPFDREEKIFAVFGVLALIWTAFVTVLMIQLYGGALLDLIEKYLGTTVAWALILAVLSYLGFRYARRWLAAQALMADARAGPVESSLSDAGDSSKAALRKRNRAIVAGISIGVAVIGLVTFSFALSRRKAPPPPEVFPFTVESPQLQDCLREVLGGKVYDVLASGKRRPARVEARRMGSCLRQFGQTGPLPAPIGTRRGPPQGGRIEPP